MTKLEFRGNDFLNYDEKVIPGSMDSLEAIAERAQQIFERWLEGQPEVYTNSKNMYWARGQGRGAFKGRVVCLECVNDKKNSKVD